MFDYLWGLLSYVIIAIPISTGVYDGLSAGPLSALISKVSLFSCLSVESFYFFIVNVDLMFFRSVAVS